MRQEGWHYELETVEGELIYNGVVFNEMKGAFSSPEQQMYSKIEKLLLATHHTRMNPVVILQRFQH